MDHISTILYQYIKKNSKKEEGGILTKKEPLIPFWNENPLLEKGKDGKFKITNQNLNLIFEHNPEIKDLYRYNSLTGKIEHHPEHRAPYSKEKIIEFTECHLKLLEGYINSFISGCGYSLHKIEVALHCNAIKSSYHPIKSFIESKPWDGIKRLDKWGMTYLGCEGTGFNLEACKLHIKAAIARLYYPGTKYDHILILKGKKGIGKTYFLENIGYPWSCEIDKTLIYKQPKDILSLLNSNWMVFLDEMGIRDIEDKIKSLITKTSDHYRGAYLKEGKRFDRTCIFWGTTDKEYFLTKDSLDDRRYFVIPCDKIDIEGIKRDKQQIFAEALNSLNPEEKLCLPLSLLSIQKEINKEFIEIDQFKEYLKMKIEEEIINAINIGKEKDFPPHTFELMTIYSLLREKYPHEISHLSAERLIKNIYSLLKEGSSPLRKRINGKDYRLWEYKK